MTFPLWFLVGSLVAMLAGTAISAGVNAYNVDKTNRKNVELAAQQNQWNLEQWQRQNAYNDPSNQVQRLAAAGINPSLSIGQSGLVDAGNSNQSPTAAGATMQPFQMADLSHFGSDILTAQQTQSNIDLQKAQADNLNANTDAIKQKLPEEIKILQDTQKQIQTGVQKLNEDIELVKSTVKNMNQDTAKKAFETSNIVFNETMADKNYQLAVKELDDTLKNSKAMRFLNSQQAFYYKQLGNLTLEDVKYASQTLYWRVMASQSEGQASRLKPALAENELRRGELTLQTLGWDLYKDQFSNPLTSISLEGDKTGFQKFGIRFGRTWSMVTGGLGAPLRGIVQFK